VKDVEGPVSETLSGIQELVRLVLVVLSKTLKYDNVYPDGRVQEILAEVPGEGQEDVKFVGDGIVSEQDAFVPPLELLQDHVQLGELSALLALVPELQL